MENEIVIENLIIEVTRNCNMRCQHCLRGDAENRKFDISILKNLLDQNVRIGQVTLSGGEPSMVPFTIENIMMLMKQYQDSIDHFYIATNGKNISPEFVIACLAWYLYSDEREMCAVELSNDYYHSIEDSQEESLLNGLSFFRKKYQDDNHETKLIREGNARDITDEEGRTVKAEFDSEYQGESIVITSEVYLNCEGNVIKGCDFSYDSQRLPENILCNVKDFRKEVELITPTED